MPPSKSAFLIGQLEAEYSTAADYNNQVIGMLVELHCQIAALERNESKRPQAVSSQHHALPMTGQPGANMATSHFGLQLPKLSVLNFRRHP